MRAKRVYTSAGLCFKASRTYPCLSMIRATLSAPKITHFPVAELAKSAVGGMPIRTQARTGTLESRRDQNEDRTG